MTATSKDIAARSTDLVLDSKVSDRGQSNPALSRNLCSALASSLQRAGVRMVSATANVHGVEKVKVRINRTGAAYENADLAAGIYRQDKLLVADTSKLEIDVTDSDFGAGSAAVLVRPIFLLLKRANWRSSAMLKCNCYPAIKPGPAC